VLQSRLEKQAFQVGTSLAIINPYLAIPGAVAGAIAGVAIPPRKAGISSQV